MSDETERPIKLTMTNTKKEMLDAYKAVLQQLKERGKAELRPERIIEEKKNMESVKTADTLSSENVVNRVSSLRLEITKMLSDLSDKIEAEVSNYRDILNALELKQNDLKEIYDIEKQAETLAALIETQQKKREDFELDMTSQKASLISEIEKTRAEWDTEKKLHEEQIKERDQAEKKNREREKEEYYYKFNREKQLLEETHADGKLRLEREIKNTRDQFEKDIADREKSVAEREKRMNELEQAVDGFTKKLQDEVSSAVKKTTEQLRGEYKGKEEFLIKGFEGERNVLNTRIESLDALVAVQKEQISNLTDQLNQTRGQVQDIAMKGIEGSSGTRLVADLLQKRPPEQPAKATEKAE